MNSEIAEILFGLGGCQVRFVHPDKRLEQGEVEAITGCPEYGQRAILVRLKWLARPAAPDAEVWLIRPGPYVLNRRVFLLDENPKLGEKGEISFPCNGQGLLEEVVFLPVQHALCLNPAVLHPEHKRFFYEMNL